MAGPLGEQLSAGIRKAASRAIAVREAARQTAAEIAAAKAKVEQTAKEAGGRK